jgi:uncharacterized protein (TIGR02996 family)
LATESPFLASIVASPHDWGPRLVFADWLEEHSDSRAELIRLLYDLTRPVCKYRIRKEHRLRRLMADGAEPVTPVVVNSIGMEFVVVPPGHFLMGSPEEEPGRDGDERQHPVTLTRGFLLGRYPVTQAQWRAVLGDNPSRYQGERLPVEHVTRVMAERFVERLSARDGRRHRLPTEAEWEYACRAGTSSPYFFGAGISYSVAAVNLRSKRRRKGVRRITGPMEVGLFPQNAWGLYDMHGNVWEWCADHYAPFTAEPQTDPLVQSTLESFVVRGGSWWNIRADARSASRHSPVSTGSAVGLRVCLEIED